MALGKSNEFQKIREDDRKAWATLEKERPTVRIKPDFVGDGSIPKPDESRSQKPKPKEKRTRTRARTRKRKRTM